MRKYLYILILICLQVTSLYAQRTGYVPALILQQLAAYDSLQRPASPMLKIQSVARTRLTIRDLTRTDISTGAIGLIPNMYNEHKLDTLSDIMDYWAKQYNSSFPQGAPWPTEYFTREKYKHEVKIYPYPVALSSLGILLAIQQRTFNEQVTTGKHNNSCTDLIVADTTYFNRALIPTLYAYKQAYDQHLSIDKEQHYINTSYRLYYNFIHEIAASLKGTPGLAPLEDFLVRYFCNPDSVMLSELASSRYAGIGSHRQYMAYQSFVASRNGFNYGITAGAWMPQGAISFLGPAPYLGAMIGGRRNNWTTNLDLFINFPFGNTRTYMVYDRDSLHASNTFLGLHATIDLQYALLRKQKSELNISASGGIQMMQVLNNNYKGVVNKVSPCPGIGIAYKLFTTRHVRFPDSRSGYTGSYACYITHYSYIALQLKYDFLFFNNYHGTSLTGNALTFGIVYGGIFRKRDFGDSPFQFLTFSARRRL